MNQLYNMSTAINMASLEDMDRSRNPVILDFAKYDTVNPKIAKSAQRGIMYNVCMTIVPVGVWMAFNFLGLLLLILTAGAIDDLFFMFIKASTAVMLIATFIMGCIFLPHVNDYRKYALWYNTMDMLFGGFPAEFRVYKDLSQIFPSRKMARGATIVAVICALNALLVMPIIATLCLFYPGMEWGVVLAAILGVVSFIVSIKEDRKRQIYNAKKWEVVDENTLREFYAR
ncbi:MAG: hypothetical protein HUJ71_03000 [Pseudobutyrivibrio sp.]|nr:hypothetical protein [Pseudobutyrivibrio sp.]